MAVRRVWRRLTLLAAILLICARNYSLIHPSFMMGYDRAPAAPMSAPTWPEQSPLLSPLGMGASNVSALAPQHASKRGFHTRRSTSTGTSRGGGQRAVNGGVDQLKRLAWYEKHFPKLDTQPGRRATLAIGLRSLRTLMNERAALRQIYSFLGAP
ncbi:hypothetical protein AB1Y20_010708 [Prymnesium parvum]|uniref:Uncharacterized protein n=1 Tax=Prymnesium parvum TaxID=97485 RepID=A0AB34IPA6_PRYPA